MNEFEQQVAEALSSALHAADQSGAQFTAWRSGAVDAVGTLASLLAPRVAAAIDAAIARTIEHDGGRNKDKPPAVDAALAALRGEP